MAHEAVLGHGLAGCRVLLGQLRGLMLPQALPSICHPLQTCVVVVDVAASLLTFTFSTLKAKWII